MAQISDWLGPFIEGEVQALLTWAGSGAEIPGIKREPDERFCDDGSNFRCTFSHDRFVGQVHPTVQITSISSVSDPVTALVTDGTTQIEARLSDEACASLAFEIGEPISSNVMGDVLDIVEATIVSHPYGVPRQQVYLEIDRLGYKHHLRKTIGKPRAIHERPTISRLVKEIASLRQRQFTLAGELGAILPNGSMPSVQNATGAIQHTIAWPATQLPSQSLDEQSSNLSPKYSDSFNAMDFDRSNGSGSANVHDFKSNYKQSAQSKTAKLGNLLAKNRDRPLPPQDFNRPFEQPVTPRKGHRQHRSGDRGDQNIPSPQRKLLDGDSSWFPSRLGRQFPHPNVPTELLKVWNDQVRAHSVEKFDSREHSEHSNSNRAQSASTLSNQVSDIPETSSGSSSSDEPLAWSPSPEFESFTRPVLQAVPESDGASNLPRTTSLPPDSSVGSSIASSSLQLKDEILKTSELQMSLQHPTQRKSLCSLSSRSINAVSPSSNEEEQDMETNVPRPLDIDPATAHRERRSEYLRSAQRNNWIDVNCTSQTPVATAFKKYKSDYPTDNVKLSHFANLVEQKVLVPSSPQQNSDSQRQASTSSASKPPEATLPARTRLPTVIAMANPLVSTTSNAISFTTDEGPVNQRGFIEFSKAWKRISPGGAFARKTKRISKANRGIDILGWNL